MSAKSVAIVLAGESDVVKISKGNSVTVQTAGKSEKFSLDGAYYAKDADQAYQSHLSKILEEVMSGNNGNLVCFGPGGDEMGQIFAGAIIPPLVKDLYSKTGLMRDLEHLVSASMMRISDKEELFDLLNPHDRKMQVRHSKQLGLYVDNLSAIVCSSAEEALCLYSEGRKMLSSMNKSRSSVFTIYISRKQRGDAAPKGIFSKITIFDMAGHDLARFGLKEVFKSAGKGKAAKDPAYPVIARLLHDALISGVTPAVIACVDGGENNAGTTTHALETAKSLSGFRSSPQRNSGDLEDLLFRIRQDIKVIRDRMMQQSQPSKKDITSLDELLADLSAAKRTGWEQRIALSNQYVEERRSNLADKGMLWVLDSGNAPSHAGIKELQNKVDQMLAEYKDQRKISDSLKEDLKLEIEQYSKLVESGKTDEKDAKSRVVKIQQMKESYKKESEKTDESRQKLKAVKEQLRKEKEAGLDVASFNFEMTVRKLEEDRKRMKHDNQQMMSEELDNRKAEVDHENAELEMRASAGQLPQTNEREMVQTASDLITLRGDKSVMTTQLDSLKKENKQLEEHIHILAEKHAKETEMQQLQNLQTFRAYREVFEEFKVELENRWRGLLDDAIQDAVFLNSRNNELLQENRRLKMEANELKDGLSIAGIPPGKKTNVTGIKEV